MTSDESDLYFKGLQSGDRFAYGKIIRKAQPPSRVKIKGLTARSLLPSVAASWNALTTLEKLAWNAAGRVAGFNPTQKNPNATIAGYRLFVQDQCLRLEYGLPGVSTPSLFAQYKVGHIQISPPATLISLIQMHPNAYWIKKKVVGSKSMYESVKVTEFLSIPLTIQLNYKSDLVACGPNPYAKFYAKIWYSYQGIDRYYNLNIDLDLQSDWKAASAIQTAAINQLVGYDLYITLNDVQGDLYFDDLKSTHDGQNWVRDPNCNDINETLTKIWYQIPKAWAALELPVGASYNSIYKELITEMNPLVITVKNNSGGTLAEGDVVVWDSTQDMAVKTDTGTKAPNFAGVVQTGGINGANITISIGGYVSKVLTVATVGTGRGKFLATGAVAKKAEVERDPPYGCFAIALTNADASGYVSACFVSGDVY